MVEIPHTALLLAKKYERLLRFLVIGVVNTAFSYLLFAIFLHISHRHNLALTLSNICGIVFNFFTTGKIVFGNKSWRTLIPFCLAYGVAFLLNLIVLNAVISLGFSALIGQAISLPVVVVVSYLINSRLVFRSAPSG